MVMVGLITIIITAVGVIIRSRLSVENPGKFQILLEDGVTGAPLPSVRNLRLVRHASDPDAGSLNGAPVTGIPIVDRLAALLIRKMVAP